MSSDLEERVALLENDLSKAQKLLNAQNGQIGDLIGKQMKLAKAVADLQRKDQGWSDV